MRFLTDTRVFLLRLSLRLWCAVFCAAYRAVEMILDCLCVVLQAHLSVVSHPLRDGVNRERFEQLDFARTAQVVKQTRPRFHVKPLDQLLKCRPQVAIPPSVRPLRLCQVVPADNMGLTRFGHFEGFFRKRLQLRE
jgi:hypothetical protein